MPHPALRSNVTTPSPHNRQPETPSPADTPLPGTQASVLARLSERIQAIDPGLTRVHSATQSLLALIIGGGAAVGFLTAIGQPAQVGALGGMVALMGANLVQGPTPRAKLKRIGNLAVAAVLSAVTAAVLSVWPFLSYAGFLAIMAVAVWIQRWGQAYMGVGMIVFIAHFNTLFLRVSPAQIPWLIPSMLLGFIGLALVTLVLLPDRARTRVRRMVPGFRARILRFVDLVREGTERGDPDRMVRALVDAAGDIQETALLIDTAFENPVARSGVADPRRLRDHAFAAEVLADHLAAVAVRTLREGDDAAREILLRQLRSVSLRSSSTMQRPPTNADLMPPHPAISVNRVADLLKRLGRALASVESAARPPGPADLALQQAWPVSEETNGASRSTAESEADRVSRARRKTVQVTLAGALSIALGMWLSAAYWYFAVLGAFFTLATTSSRAASVRRAVDRILGTAVGVAGGVGLAALLAGSTGAELVVIAALAFIAFWSFKGSYMVMVFLFTALVALVYDMMGIYSVQVLLVRLWETLIGAGFGALVAFLVLPVSTRSSLDEHLATSLEALDGLLGALDPRSAAPATHETVYSRIRELDRAVSAFREAGKPLASGLPVRFAREALRDILLMSSLRFRAHDLATAATGTDGLVRPVEPEAVPTLDAVRRRAASIRLQIDQEEASRHLPPVTDADDRALAAAPGRTGDALRAIYERLESFAESRALAAEADPTPTDT